MFFALFCFVFPTWAKGKLINEACEAPKRSADPDWEKLILERRCPLGGSLAGQTWVTWRRWVRAPWPIWAVRWYGEERNLFQLAPWLWDSKIHPPGSKHEAAQLIFGPSAPEAIFPAAPSELVSRGGCEPPCQGFIMWGLIYDELRPALT